LSAVAQRLRLEGAPALGRRRAARLLAALVLLVEAARRVLVVRLIQDVGDVLVVHVLGLEAPVCFLNVREIAHAQRVGLDLIPESLLELAVLLELGLDGLVESLVEDLICANLIGLVSPLLANLIETLEVNRSPAHRAALARALLVPRLDASVAEAVPAGQLAAGVVTVANGALHCSGFVVWVEVFVAGLRGPATKPFFVTIPLKVSRALLTK
jgi:hypothetical protein